MARTITDEEIKLSIIINGNPAQKQLLDLEKSTRALTQENKALLLEKKRLEAQGKKETEDYKKLTQTIRENTRTIDNNKATMKELQNQIGITGLTMGQLNSKANQLKLTLKDLVPNSSDYKKYNAELKQVTDRINELKGKSNQAGFSIGSLADKFNRYAALGASVLGFFAGMVVSVQKIIDLNGKLSDAQSNVMKTTGMTKKEVDELTKSFGALKSRTGRIELLGIAEVGGRLGIAKEEIGSFVKVMDKASVALGDSFEGGPEVVADKLGKIKGLYQELKDTKVEEAFESVGSALNDLGASGTASEQNVAEFVTRVGSLPSALKPSIDQALGLGAAFEESGLKAEVAGSNYGKVISIAARDFKQFAQVMGLPAEKVKEMINTDPTQFFLNFANSLKGLDATELAKILDYLKLNDNEVKMVLGAAAENTQLFVDKMDLAKNSMLDASSLTQEFNIKNNNLAATLEKIKKTASGWFSSDEFVKWLEKSVNWFAELIGATDNATNKTQAFKNTLVIAIKFIAIIAAALATKVAWQKLAAMWDAKQAFLTRLVTNEQAFYNAGLRVRAVLENLSIIRTQAMAAGTALWNLQMRSAVLSIRAMGTAFMALPWGAIITGIVTLYATYKAFSNEVDESNEKMNLQSEIMNKVNDSTTKHKEGIKLLVGVLNDENASRDEKVKALDRLKSATDGYLESLTIENFKTKESQALINDYIKSIDDLAEAKAVLEIKTKLITERIESENKSKALTNEKKSNKNTGNSWMGDDGKFFGLGDRNQMEIQMEIDAEKKQTESIKRQEKAIENRRLLEIAALRKDIKIKEEELKNIDKKSQSYIRLKNSINSKYKVLNTLLGISDDKETYESGIKSSGNNIPGDEKGKKKEKKKEYDDSYLSDEKKFYDDLLKLQRQNELDSLELMEDDVHKEIALQKIKHEQKIDELTRQNEEYNKITDSLEKKITEATKSGDTKKVSSLKKQQEYVAKMIVANNETIEHEEKLHLLKLGTLQEKAGKAEIEEIKEQYQKEKIVRETAFLEELNALDLSDKEKAKRKEKFQKEESEKEIEFLNKQVETFKKMLTDTPIDGVQFDLLSEKDKDKLAEDIEKILNAIAKIKEAKNGKNNDSEKEIDLGLTSAKDVLGYSQDQWDKFFQNINNGTIGLQTMQMAVGAVQDLWGKFSEYQNASDAHNLKKYERNSDIRKKKLKQQLDAGYINQSQYKRGVEQIDQELDRKKAEIEYKQAKRQRIMAIANVITSTAQAIMGIWAQVPKFDFGATAGILTGIVAATGALQLGTILKTPLPAKGAEDGYYPNLVRREQDGKIFRTTGTSKVKTGLYSKPRLLVGEGPGDMPEMVIDKKAFAQISPETKSALLREISTIKGFENGYYKKGTFYSGDSNASNQNNNNEEMASLVKLALAVVAQNTEVMEDIKKYGIQAYMSNKDFKSMKNFKDGLDDYQKFKDKTKQ